MRCVGGRLEMARDSMGHAGSTGSITLDVYSKTWWDERVDGVTRVVEAVFTEPEVKKTIAIPPMDLPRGGNGVEWEPFWEPQGALLASAEAGKPEATAQMIFETLKDTKGRRRIDFTDSVRWCSSISVVCCCV
jgi:hypothetical protein